MGEAWQWYQKAAKQGNADAAYRVAQMVEAGTVQIDWRISLDMSRFPQMNVNLPKDTRGYYQLPKGAKGHPEIAERAKREYVMNWYRVAAESAGAQQRLRRLASDQNEK